MDAEEQRRQFVQTLLREDLNLHDVGQAYFAMTGSASEEEVALYTLEMLMLPQNQRDLLTLAIRSLLQGQARRAGFENFTQQPDDHCGAPRSKHDDEGGKERGLERDRDRRKDQ
ncbi:hypothetical protein [Arthrobacter zhaoguopingii]|uniref:hypothetical protein n=1 Tax=Arthrobacter zhaoguopingii TaxID=2681491 RepID=UPI00135A02F7|nr:hypothetical protein [Arthrobacter zhaoguopingii]